MLTISDINALFDTEFTAVKDRFCVIEISIAEAMSNGSLEVNSPGVYVFWNPALGVIKVGKSQSNSKKRALQHIRDNTRKEGVEMASLENDGITKMLLFNILNKKDLHWLLSLEAYFEWNSNPKINSARMG